MRSHLKKGLAVSLLLLSATSTAAVAQSNGAAASRAAGSRPRPILVSPYLLAKAPTTDLQHITGARERGFVLRAQKIVPAGTITGIAKWNADDYLSQELIPGSGRDDDIWPGECAGVWIIEVSKGIDDWYYYWFVYFPAGPYMAVDATVVMANCLRNPPHG